VSALHGGWTVNTELLAQLIEEVSILASDRRRETPTSIPRPYTPDAPAAPQHRGAQQPQQTDAASQMSGHRQMLAAAMQRGMVRSG
jgi:hypothetical protein